MQVFGNERTDKARSLKSSLQIPLTSDAHVSKNDVLIRRMTRKITAESTHLAEPTEK
jgi:hypothetical protein